MDPFPHCRNRSHELAIWEEDRTIEDYVPEGFDSPLVVCIRNGKMTPQDRWAETPVEFGDDLSFVEVPAYAAAVFLVEAIVYAVISYGVSLGINALFGVGEVDQPFDNAPDPTYAFTGIRNTSASGIPIPIAYGEHKLGGNFIDIRVGGNNPYLSGQSFGNLIDTTLALSEGPIDAVLETRINGNLIAEYGSTVFQTVTAGTGSQATLGGGGAAATFNVNLELLEGGGSPYDPATWTGGPSRGYTTSQAVDRVQINILHPRGLVHVDEQDGFYHLQGVAWQTRWSVASAGTWSAWSSVGGFTESNVVSVFTSTTEIIFPSQGLYDIEVRRWSTAPQTQYFITDIEFDSVTEWIEAGFTYPHTAVSRIRIEADRSISGSLPTITHKIRGIKVTKWDGVSVTSPNFVDAFPYRNPAWISLDLILNARYGLGRWWSVANVDLDSFLDWAEWCDELVSDGVGGFEPRCLFDGVLDGTSGSAWDRLLQIAATARASFVVVGDLLKVKVEKPRAAVQLFTMGNIRQGSWRQEWVSDTLRPTRFEIVYLNAEKDYGRDDEGIDDEDAITQGLPQRSRSITRMGITRRSQALREAKFALNLYKLKQVVSFDADIDAVTAEAGDLVQVAHDVPAWGFSGRLVADSNDILEVRLDRAVTIETGQSYEVIVRHAGDLKESLTVTQGPGTHAAGQAIAVTAASVTPTKGSIYAFGRVNVSTQTVKVTGIRTGADLSRSITGVVYDSRIHEDDIGLLDTLVITELPDPGLLPPCPTGITANALNSSSGGAISYGVTVAWVYPTGNIGHGAVYYRDITGYVAAGTTSVAPWVVIGNALFPQSEVTVTTGFSLGSTYEFTVVVTSTAGAQRLPGACATVTLEITGGSGPVPASPTGLALVQSGDDLILTWAAVTNIPVSHYLVRRGGAWVGSREVGQSSTTQLVTQRWAPTEGSSIEERFHVRAVSQAGAIGQVSTIITSAGGLFVWQGGAATQADEANAGWLGSKTNWSVVGGNLELITDTDPGTYTTAAIDTGSAGTYRIGAVMHATHADGPGWSASTWNSSYGRQNAWNGYVDPDQWRTTYTLDFQASANNIAYSDWMPLITQTVVGAVIAGTMTVGMRYFRVRLVATPTDPIYSPIISQLFITMESR